MNGNLGCAEVQGQSGYRIGALRADSFLLRLTGSGDIGIGDRGRERLNGRRANDAQL